MVISLSAVNAYLEAQKKFADSSKVKRFTREALLAKINRLDPIPEFHTEPRTSQLACFLLGVKYPGYMFTLDMGVGKTKLTLDLISYAIRCGTLTKALVLVPYSSNVGSWLNQVEEHVPHLRAAGLNADTKEERLERLQDDENQIIVATYAGWMHLVCSKQSQTGKKQKKMKVDAKKERRALKGIGAVVFDETSVYLRRYGSVMSQLARHLQKHCWMSFGLTGTPFDKSPEDFWHQFYVCDGGTTLGATLGLFRAAFFSEEEDYFAGAVYTFKKSMTETLARRLRHRSIRYAIEEVEELPEFVPIMRKLVMPDDTLKYYAKLKEELESAQGNFHLLENAFMRMRQLCSGFLPVLDDEDGRHEIVFQNNPKLDMLIDQLRDVPDGRKVVLWHDFTKSGELIIARLKKEKIKHLVLGGKSKKKADIESRFADPKQPQVLVSSMAGAFGMNFQTAANYALFYECPPAAITRHQAERRLWRPGQTKTVFNYDFVYHGMVCEKIIKAIEAGKDLFEELVEGRTKL